MALSSSLNLIIVKAGKQFSGYVSNFTQSKKYKTKVTLFSKSRSLVFTFALKRELDSSSFFVLATKLFHITGSPIDILNLLLHSLVFGLLQLMLEKRVWYEWERISKVVSTAAGSTLVFYFYFYSSFYFMHEDGGI